LNDIEEGCSVLLREFCNQKSVQSRHFSWNKRVLVLSVALAVAATAPHRASGLIVFDPQNYSQNLLTATRTLEAIQNQIKSLENESQMLINQAKNLAAMPQSIVAPLTSDIAAIRRLTAQAEGVAFDVRRSMQEFRDLYPGLPSSSSAANGQREQAEARWNNSYTALKQTLATQSKVIESIEGDSKALAALLNTSTQAKGALEALQAGNELLALQVKQNLATQTLIAAQARADALKSAEDRAGSIAAKERFTKFIGSSKAYQR
jgi:type IV secretion system protein TrbJ